MDRWVGRVALVTGASGGIGAAICRQLVDAGMKVVGAARSLDKIQALSNELKGRKGSLTAIQCDISKDEDVQNLFSTIKQKFGGVDVCINNAGLDTFSSLMDGDVQKWRAMLDINVIGLSLCTKEALASMKERNVDDGQIIHVSSLSGHNVFNPQFISAMYTASKFAVRALTEGLRLELQNAKSRIRVASISPGGVQTSFLAVQQNIPQQKSEEYMGSFGFKFLQASDVADSVMHIIAAPPHVRVGDILLYPNEQPNL